MVNHIFMYSFVYAFFSDKTKSFLFFFFFFFIFTLHTLHVKANLRRVQNVICWEEKKSNVILVMIFRNNFHALIFCFYLF